MRFANGCVATITASRISLKTERKMRLFSQEGYMSVDFAARKLMMIGRERGLPLPGTGGGRLEEITWKDHDALAAEHAAFAAAMLDGAPVVVDATAGAVRWRRPWPWAKAWRRPGRRRRRRG